MSLKLKWKWYEFQNEINLEGFFNCRSSCRNRTYACAIPWHICIDVKCEVERPQSDNKFTLNPGAPEGWQLGRGTYSYDSHFYWSHFHCRSMIWTSVIKFVVYSSIPHNRPKQTTKPSQINTCKVLAKCIKGRPETFRARDKIWPWKTHVFVLVD